MKRVLHIVSSLSRNSGVMSVVMNYFREIDRSFFLFDFAYFKSFPDDIFYKDEIEKLGGRFIKIPQLSLTNRKEFSDSLHSIIKREDYYAIHCHEAILTNFIYKQCYRDGVKRLIIHSHTARLSDTRLGIIRNRLMLLNSTKKTANLIACSEIAGEYVFGKKSFQKKGTVILNGVDLSKFSYDKEAGEQKRKDLRIESDVFVIGTVGRCSRIKNHEFLIELVKHILPTEQKIALIIVGNGESFDSLRIMTERYLLSEYVFFVGSQTSISDWLSAMDLFLFPSLAEGFGLSLVEAQANGLPCVASDKVPVETSIGGEVNYLPIKKKDIVFWKECVIQYLHRGRQRYSYNKLMAANLSIRKCTKDLEKYYCRLESYEGG